MALSSRAFDRTEPCAAEFTAESKPTFLSRLDRLKADVVKELQRQGFANDRIELECYLNMRSALLPLRSRPRGEMRLTGSANTHSYDGSDTSLMTLAPADGSFDFAKAFEAMYKDEFGFLLDAKAIMVDDVRVRGIGKTFDSLGQSVLSEIDETAFASEGVDAKAEKERASMYFEATGRVDVPVWKLDNLVKGDVVSGPGAIVDGTQTLILDPGAEAKICSRHVYITLS